MAGSGQVASRTAADSLQAVTRVKIDVRVMSSGTDALHRHREAASARLLRTDHERAGPGSVSWKINREVIVVAGWGRAILLQLAHPAVAAGVHHHSAFPGTLRSSFRRLHSTVGSMLALTFGDTEQMITAAARINTIHDRVRGRIDEGTNDTYSAHDPALQRWVHATLLESIPLIYELLVGPLTVRERDQVLPRGRHHGAAAWHAGRMAPAGFSAARRLHARDAGGREPHRHRHQPGARPSHVVPAAVARLLARISSRPAAHDRHAAARAAPGIRLRVARARSAGLRAVDDGAACVAAIASAVRT